VPYQKDGMVQPEAFFMAHICNHCEDFENPVTSENGTSLKYPVETQPGGLEVDLYLHEGCAEAWSRDFNIPVPPRAVGTQPEQVTPTSVGCSVNS